MPLKTDNDRDEKTTRAGWRMAGLAGETASYVVAGGLLGWGVNYLFQIEWGIVVGAVMGILCGITNLIRGSLKLNAQLDRQTQKRSNG